MNKTIVVIAAKGSSALPKDGDIIYFEIPEALGTIRSLRADVHVYIFDTLPNSPIQALSQLTTARASLWCTTEGLEMGRGGVELRADWFIENRRSPELKPTSRPFRPATSPGMQQVRVQVHQSVFAEFEYLFDTGRTEWRPVFDLHDELTVPEMHRNILAGLMIREDVGWYRVRGLEAGSGKGASEYEIALKESAPESGSFILMSLRRRRRRRSRKERAS